MKPWPVVAAAGGFVLGWATAIAMGLWGSKFASDNTRLVEQYGPTGAPGKDPTGGWLDKYEDMHDVLPAGVPDALPPKDYEWSGHPFYGANLASVCRVRSAYRYLCTQPTGHGGPHIATGPQDEVYDAWGAS